MTNATNQSENSSTSGNQNEASSAGNKPDWESFSLEDKLNFLIDMSYNNSQCIQTISKNLDNHCQEIKSLVANLELNNIKIKTLSENFAMVNKSLADITENQAVVQKDISDISNKLNLNSQKCDDDAASITMLQAAFNSVAGTSTPPQAANYQMSSELLLSGISETTAADQT
ncbi:hypothetical protein KQX54_003381, partial [Cotesia glomerata]